jgi:hypothetical protein
MYPPYDNKQKEVIVSIKFSHSDFGACSPPLFPETTVLQRHKDSWKIDSEEHRLSLSPAV